jgi:hypothetical protein
MPPTSVTETSVLDALKAVRDPDLNRDIVSLKFIKNLRIDGGVSRFRSSSRHPLARSGSDARTGAVGCQRAARGDRRRYRDDGTGPLDHGIEGGRRPSPA